MDRLLTVRKIHLAYTHPKWAMCSSSKSACSILQATLQERLLIDPFLLCVKSIFFKDLLSVDHQL